MAIKDYSAAEREVIGRFLGDRAAWMEIGMDTPAGDFEDLERLAEKRGRAGDAVKKRREREDALCREFADEKGYIGGRLKLTVKQAARAVVEPGLGGTNIYTNDRTFERYLGVLRVLCEELTKG